MNALLLCSPRSGAAWVTTLLRNLGLPATHEVLFRPEPPRPVAMPPDWIEASWCAVPFAAAVDAELKLHLVRNPLHVVRSILRIQLFDRPLDPFVRLARDNTDCWQDRTPLGNACYMVEHWFNLARMARSVDDVFHLEEGSDLWRLVQHLSTDVSTAVSSDSFLRALSEMPDRINQRGDSSADLVTWDEIEIIRPGLLEIAFELGYL